MQTARDRARLIVAFLAMWLVATGCSRGPEQAELEDQIRTKLEREVKPGLFELTGLKRSGSAWLPDGVDGTERLVVYFNATLRFLEGYDFGGWEKLSISTLARALGATDKGIFGITGENAENDVVSVFGSVAYKAAPGGWEPISGAPDAVAIAPELENTAPPSRSKQLIDQLAAMVDIPPPGVGPGDDEVISDELRKAADSIQRRLARRKHVYVLACGPADGEYARFCSALTESLQGVKADGPRIDSLTTDGSVANAWLLARGEVDYGLMQSDVAAAAVAGDGPFARGGPLTTLRAVASLFPEAAQIVVRASSPIRRLADLRGKRVDIGRPGSGTQFDAEALLASAGLTLSDLREARQEGLEAATVHLETGQLDAFFATGMAPIRAVSQLAERQVVRFVPLSSAEIDEALLRRPGLVRLMLPANTYPTQREVVYTVAAAALFVTTAEVAEAEVANVVGHLLSRGIDLRATGSVESSKVSRRTILVGITIPLHPGASKSLSDTASAPPGQL